MKTKQRPNYFAVSRYDKWQVPLFIDQQLLDDCALPEDDTSYPWTRRTETRLHWVSRTEVEKLVDESRNLQGDDKVYRQCSFEDLDFVEISPEDLAAIPTEQRSLLRRIIDFFLL